MRTLRGALVFVWPFLAVLALTSILVAGVLSAMATIGQRDRLVEQSKQVKALVEAQAQEAKDRADEEDDRRKESAVRMAEALAEVDKRFEAHDAKAAQAHEDMLRRMAELLGRPAGVNEDPVIARGMGRTVPRASSSPSHPAPRTTTPRRTAPAPTSPRAAPAPRSTATTAAPAPTAATAPPPPGCDKGKAKKC